MRLKVILVEAGTSDKRESFTIDVEFVHVTIELVCVLSPVLSAIEVVCVYEEDPVGSSTIVGI